MRRGLAALFLVAAATMPAQASQVVLVLRTRVSDAAGRACAGLPIAVTSTASSGAMATTTDGDGRSLLPLMLGSRSDLARAPVVVRLRSGSSGSHLETKTGASEIALSFGIPADDTTLLQIITSGGEVGSRIADAFRQATSDTVEAVVDLRCAKGAGNTSGRVDLDYSGRVPLPKRVPGAPTRTALPAQMPVQLAPSRDSTRTAPPPRPGPAPATVPRDRGGAPTSSTPPPAPASAPDTLKRAVAAPAIPCDCRLVGTVEVESDRPIEDRLRIIVRVQEQPAFADTVELYMGSPRPFRIAGLPCGDHHLDVSPLSRRRFRVVSPDPTQSLPCTSGTLIQPRVILVPR